MDGFFEKYGRVIIIAVAICFVLLFLTPMRNVVGSSINGFAGNFANKVGESLGTVKMPDGSGGKITVPEGVKAGSILKIEGNEYIVLEQKNTHNYLVMRKHFPGEGAFHRTLDSNGLRKDGLPSNTYESSDIDKGLEEYINVDDPEYASMTGFTTKLKSAIQLTSIKQSSYTLILNKNEDGWETIEKKETGPNGQIYNVINRFIFLPSVDEVSKIVDLDNPEKLREFLGGTTLMTRDSRHDNNDSVITIDSNYKMFGSTVYYGGGIRPTFVVDLTKVQSEIVGTTNYK